jgi:Haem-NO-binding
MYGLVNKGIEDLVVSRFGEPSWEAIKKQAGVDVDAFVSMEAYSDEVTYKLVGAASEVLGIPAHTVLETFGEFWILFTAGEGYGPLLDIAGKDLASFLQHLDEMHTRVGVALPKLQPPSFWCTDVTPGTIRLHYRTHRRGLAPLVIGIIKGLGRRFETEVDVVHVARREAGADHDEFLVTYVQH